MSKKYIVAMLNSEPAPPELEYFCGLSQHAREKTIEEVREKGDCTDLLWDTDPECALRHKFMDGAADDCQLLLDMGYDGSLIRVYEAEMSYVPVDKLKLHKLMMQRQVHAVMEKLTTEDINYLENLGILDLTKVT